MGIILIYDVTQQDSFQNIRRWIHDIHENVTNDSVNIILIGNKCDLNEQRVVPTARGKSLADEYGIAFFETSAKEDINVQESFTALVRQVCNRLYFDPNTQQQQTEESTVKIRQGVADTSTKRCC